eukprot:CAMPEP_0116871976 /NCGR_PEP_ID=MMETSP0463-20121206/2555_1 /TAXON_ID=181622 /ORGANISM="Strombidinopsis sp, Strain SopsisLIS2011" /LENGTH=81 /DNA_ID=CAMNT_0004511393 /DNA_START=556 /DNA_END=804 /DNA_ORIENTATION=-
MRDKEKKTNNRFTSHSKNRLQLPMFLRSRDDQGNRDNFTKLHIKGSNDAVGVDENIIIKRQETEEATESRNSYSIYLKPEI